MGGFALPGWFALGSRLAVGACPFAELGADRFAIARLGSDMAALVGTTVVNRCAFAASALLAIVWSR
ncbi:hypothetical protein D3C80_2211060 [compost metagenome]